MTTASSAAVDLAREPDFALGDLWVSPSACRVRADGAEHRIEPRVMQVLVVLAKRANQTVTRDELIEACWEGRIVGDDAISRVVAQVRNLGRRFTPAPFVLETVPKVGFRLIAPAGAEESPRPPDPARRAAGPGRRLGARGVVAIVVAALIAALGGWAVWRNMSSAGLAAGQNGRVEVMRFEALHADPELQRLSEAIGAGVVRVLASSGVETTGQTVNRDAGGRGDAEFRIAGSVDRDGDRYVVNGQILDRRTGAVLWSDSIDRPVAAVAGFPDEAAHSIAGFMRCGLLDRGSAPKPLALSAFGLLLSACSAAIKGDHARMMDVTRRLVEAAPDLPNAHAMHALAASALANGPGTSARDVDALNRVARASAEQALKLDPKTAKAHVALAQTYGASGHWIARERHFRQALDLDPALLPARSLYAELLAEVGRVDEALAIHSRTIAADPVSAGNLPAMALLNAQQGNVSRAHALLDRLAPLRPEIARRIRFVIAAWWEDPAAARPKIGSLGHGFMSDAGLACLTVYLERLPTAKASGALGLPAGCAELPPDWRVRMLARQGALDAAYAEAARMDGPLSRRTHYLFYPEMKAFRQDARFMPLAKELGLVDYWRSSGAWADFCAEPDLPYDCRARAEG